jgi:hypothetical protein
MGVDNHAWIAREAERLGVAWQGRDAADVLRELAVTAEGVTLGERPPWPSSRALQIDPDPPSMIPSCAEQEATEARRKRDLEVFAGTLLDSIRPSIGLEEVVILVAETAGRVAAVSTLPCQTAHARVAWAYLHALGVPADRPMTEREFSRAATMLSRLRNEEDPDSLLVVDALVYAFKKEP